jgi:hypothetical protein
VCSAQHDSSSNSDTTLLVCYTSQQYACQSDLQCNKCRSDYWTVVLTNPCDVALMTADLLLYHKYWSDKAGLLCDGTQALTLLTAEAQCIAYAILQFNSQTKYDSNQNKQLPSFCQVFTGNYTDPNDNHQYSGAARPLIGWFVRIFCALSVGLVTLLL